MKQQKLHSWNVTPREAIAIQQTLRARVVRRDALARNVRHVAGVDVGFEENGAITRAAVAVLGLSDLELKDSALARLPTSFPYVPGLLSFREVPAVLDALQELRIRPQLLLCDGQGLAHPRRFGIACHLGVLTGIPSIGVAKKILVGRHEPVPDERGAWRPLLDKDEVVGAALRTRVGVKPIYVSQGHKVSLETSIDYVMRATTRYRLPETTRQAHRLASAK